MQVEIKDYGTSELHRQRNVQIRNGKARVYASTPLDYFREKMIISDDQWMAGDKLSYLFMLSNLNLYKAPKYAEQPGQLSDGEGSERYEVEYKQAVKSVHYRNLSVTRNVCCFHDRTNDIGGLREGLNDLVRFFGIKSW